MKQLRLILTEDDYYTLGYDRPDANRRDGRLTRVQKKRSGFPYDLPTTYGQPGAYDRGSSGAGEMHQPLVPKDTEHSAWVDADDIKKEVTGVAGQLIGKSQNGQGPSTLPGAAKGWAGMPPLPWDEDDEDARIDAAGKVDEYADMHAGRSIMTINPSHPDPEPIPNEKSPYTHDMTDEDLEDLISSLMPPSDLMEPGPSAIHTFGGPAFTSGLGGTFKGKRDLYGMDWQEAFGFFPNHESIWRALESIVENLSD